MNWLYKDMPLPKPKNECAWCGKAVPESKNVVAKAKYRFCCPNHNAAFHRQEAKRRACT